MTAQSLALTDEAETLQPVWSNHPLATWLAENRHAPNETEEFYRELHERLVANGIPIYRASSMLFAMHPLLVGRYFWWHRDRGVEVFDLEWGAEQSETYTASPLYVIHQGVDSLRRRLDVPEPQLDFAILAELKDEGATDYVATALRFSTGQINSITWSTRRPGGFSTEQLTLLYDLVPLISLRLELANAYDMGQSLLTTYLGQAAARRVLSGTVKRADGERIRAAIFYADLRNFTAMADAAPSEEVIETLNDYFDCVIAPVKSRGGEVLKFIGDGMLAIFPAEPGGMDSACCDAVAAAIEGFGNLMQLNQRRVAAGQAPLKSGVALHAGEVMFGNIGSADRLDFTGIGPAVNEVSRVEELTHMLDRPVLASAGFARCQCGISLESVGFHVLRGVRQPRELFAVPAALLPAAW